MLTAIYAIGAVNRLIGGGGVGGRNLVPFQTIAHYLTDPNVPTQLRLMNLVGNVVLLAPLGLALAAATRLQPRRVLQVLLATAVAIEAFQFAGPSSRSVDIDDVILNTIGGGLGYLAGLIALRFAGAALPSLVADGRISEPTRAAAPHPGARTGRART